MNTITLHNATVGIFPVTAEFSVSLRDCLDSLTYDKGEARLMLAVLKDAVECIERYRTGRGSRSRAAYDAALRWVCTHNPHWPFSFDSICLELDLDPDRLRSFLASESVALITTSPANTSHLRASATPRPALTSQRSR
jgi:hypothetical protein